MNNWFKYIAFVIIALFFVAFVFDAIKVAKIQGSTKWKQILVSALVFILIIAITVGVNYFINRNWIPGKMIFTIRPF